jgi:hypothetical protein
MTNLELILKRFFARYSAEHPAITTLDLSTATADYALQRKNQNIVLTNNHATPWDMNLPRATGSGSIISISNQDNVDLIVNPNGTDTLNGVNSAKTIVTLNSAMFVDYVSGKWAIVADGLDGTDAPTFYISTDDPDDEIGADGDFWAKYVV